MFFEGIRAVRLCCARDPTKRWFSGRKCPPADVRCSSPGRDPAGGCHISRGPQRGGYSTNFPPFPPSAVRVLG